MKNSEKPVQPICSNTGVPFNSDDRRSVFNLSGSKLLVGLTKREYFFASVLQGLAANASKNTNSPEHLVELAKSITDKAMEILDKD